jgi:DNA-binding transcriptional ArsR family regulator
MFPAQIAKKLDIHEQNVYYHLKPLIEGEIIEIIEKKEIRGTIAKKYKLAKRNIITTIAPEWKKWKGFKEEIPPKVKEFFQPFISEGKFKGFIIVGSPDPHGPHKSRARDGHYGIDLAMYLGNLVSLSKDFSTFLDVDVNLKTFNHNLIIVGGPVTNLITAEINEFLPYKFTQGDMWGIKSKKLYTEDNIGLISKIENPYFPDKTIILLAGNRFNGTKAAVIGLTRYTEQILVRFSHQKNFSVIVEGFDIDADGRIDHIELIS